MIDFSCNQCGRKFRVKDEMQGKKAKCPCGKSIVVPALAAPPTSPFVFSEPSEPEPLELEPAPIEGNGKRPICGILAAIFGGGALLFAVLGCVVYLIVWLSLEDYEKMGVVGDSAHSAEKVLLPKILNYFSLLAGLGAIVLGIVSICIEKARKPAIAGTIIASAALVMLFAFWIWTVSRRWEDYARDLRW